MISNVSPWALRVPVTGVKDGIQPWTIPTWPVKLPPLRVMSIRTRLPLHTNKIAPFRPGMPEPPVPATGFPLQPDSPDVHELSTVCWPVSVLRSLNVWMPENVQPSGQGSFIGGGGPGSATVTCAMPSGAGSRRVGDAGGPDEKRAQRPVRSEEAGLGDGAAPGHLPADVLDGRAQHHRRELPARPRGDRRVGGRYDDAPHRAAAGLQGEGGEETGEVLGVEDAAHEIFDGAGGTRRHRERRLARRIGPIEVGRARRRCAGGAGVRENVTATEVWIAVGPSANETPARTVSVPVSLESRAGSTTSSIIARAHNWLATDASSRP